MFKLDKTHNNKINKSVRLPKYIIDEIESICKKENITFTDFITQALIYVLKDYKSTK